MKILTYEHYNHAVHGNQRYLLILMQAMGKGAYADMDFHLAVRGQGDFSRQASELGQVTEISARSLPLRCLELSKLIAKLKPDVLFCNNEASVLTAAPGALLHRVPIVWYIKNHGTFTWSDIMCSWLARRILCLARQSVECKHPLAQRFAAPKLHVLPNGIRLGEFLSVPEQAPHDPPHRVLMLSSITKPKGIDTAIEAMQILDSQGVRATLRILGGTAPGSEAFAAQMQTLTKGLVNCTVEWLGWRPNVIDYLAWCDFVILPSRAEAVPRSIIEAMGTGRITIASNIGGVPTLIEDSATGLLIPPDNARALATAMRRLMDNPEDNLRMARNARQYAIKNHDIERHLESFVGHLRATAKRRQ